MKILQVRDINIIANYGTIATSKFYRDLQVQYFSLQVGISLGRSGIKCHKQAVALLLWNSSFFTIESSSCLPLSV